MHGYLYKLSLRDLSGAIFEIEAIGIEKLSSNYAGVKAVGVKDRLKHIPGLESLTDKRLGRRGGELDVLVENTNIVLCIFE